MPASELKLKYKQGSMIHLQGFTSTTHSRETALDFAIGNLTEEVENPEKTPVLIEIIIEGDN